MCYQPHLTFIFSTETHFYYYVSFSLLLLICASSLLQHAWDEPIGDFVEAIERSGEEGPFWICALAIYQNGDPSKGVTIGQQLGTNPEAGPFATVLKGADLMLAVLTSVCDIYTRLW